MKISKTDNKLVPHTKKGIQSGHLRWSDNRGQEKVRRNFSVRPSLIKQSLLGSWSLAVDVYVCHVRWDCTCAMLSWLVCRNGLHKHDFWEIIKSKIRHSYELHTYLRYIGFARWFQRIECLFGGNWANGPSVRNKCPYQFSHGRECSISMYGEWCGETCPNCHVCGSLCVSGTMLRQNLGPRRVPREHAEYFLSIVGHTNAEQRYH